MANSEEPKRNIDERLDALSMNLELLYRDQVADREEMREIRESIKDMRDSMNVLRDSTERLVIVAQSHENRIEKLERAS